MEKTYLESSLEEGLAKLDMPFRDRITYRDLVIGSNVDDIMNPLPHEPEFVSIEEELLYHLLGIKTKNASFYQTSVVDEELYLFQRFSEIKKGFRFTYGVDAGELNSSDNIGEIIREKKFNYQFADIAYNNSFTHDKINSLDFFNNASTIGGFCLYNDGKVEFLDISSTMDLPKEINKDYTSWTVSMRFLEEKGSNEEELSKKILYFLRKLVYR